MKLDANTLKNILESKIFVKVLEKATFLVTKNKKLSSLAIATLKKLVNAGSIRSLGVSLIKQIKLLAHLVYFYASGQYRDISKKSIAIVTAVIMYFILPIDLIPDFLPGMGYIDDITLVGWVFTTLASELSLFEIWLNNYNKAETIKYIDLE